MLTLDAPKYQQIADVLARRIRGGEYGVGHQLPSEHDLSRTFNVSRVTTRQALSVLESAKLVDRRRGSGTFVSDQQPLVDTPVLTMDGTRVGNLCLLLCDMARFQGTSRTHRDVGAATAAVHQRGLTVTVGSLESASCMDGVAARSACASDCQGVLLDGYVSDIHHAVCRHHLDVPSLVVGNHHLASGTPQVRLDVAAYLEAGLAALRGVVDGPLMLLCDPFLLAMTDDIVAGYVEYTVREGLPQGIFTPPRGLVDQDIDTRLEHWDGGLAVEGFLRQGHRRFGLFVQGTNFLPSMLETLDRRGLGPADVPVVVLDTVGSLALLSPRQRARVHQLPVDLKGLYLRAIEVLERDAGRAAADPIVQWSDPRILHPTEARP